MNRFYVYAFLRADGTPYYVGKGTNGRQWDRRKGSAKLPTDPARNIRLLDGMTEEDAFAWEKLLIARWGRKDLGTGILRNGTDGGEGASNPSADARAKLGEAIKASLWNDPEARTKTRASMKATWANPEVRARRSSGIKEALSKPEVHAARIAAIKAAKGTTTSRARTGAISRAAWDDPETRARRSAINRASTAKVATKGAAELGIPLDVYLAMPSSSRSAARKKKREAAAHNKAPVDESTRALSPSPSDR